MKRVIYIMGAGRSGTTLLDIILGNANDIFSCGELISFPKLKGIPHGFEKESKQFLFWKNVEKSLFEKNKEFQYDDLIRTVNAVESHRTFFNNLFRLTPARILKDYYQYIDNFFESLFSHIKEDIVVDSSKYPGRAFALSRQNKWQIDYIYLIRNPIGVVHSFSKSDVEQPRKGFLFANIYYFVINMMCQLVKIHIGESKLLTIRYEDFLRNSTEVLHRIEYRLSLDLRFPKRLIEDNIPLKVGCLFEGNRIRLKNEIIISRKNSDFHHSWKNIMTTLFNGWWWRTGF